MQKHKGETIEIITRRHGYPLKKIAKLMNISRSTLYNRFKDPNVSDDFIINLSKAIDYDLSKEFPDIKNKLNPGEVTESASTYQRLDSRELLLLQKKYYQLLEDYNSLLKFFIKLADTKDDELPERKKEIIRFLKEL